jgi:hypothetical protein
MHLSIHCAPGASPVPIKRSRIEKQPGVAHARQLKGHPDREPQVDAHGRPPGDVIVICETVTLEGPGNTTEESAARAELRCKYSNSGSGA